MTKSLYEYRSYKSYLSDSIAEKPSNGRGERSKIAKILNCHLAYVSQVLNGPAQLSLEQADALNEYLGHSPSEADFFLLLVQVDRAGTESLKKRFLKRVEQIVSERELLKNRLLDQKELSKDIQPEYYSYWYYTAIHFLIACPEFQTKEALCEKLSLPMPLVTQVLEFLLSTGLAVQKGNRYDIGTSRIHLGSDSPLIAKHHSNWRMQALQSLDRKDNKELHYSSVLVVDKKQVPEIKAIMVKAIEEVRKVMKPSSSYDTLYCYALDLFEVGAKSESTAENKIFDKRRKTHENQTSLQH